MESKKKQKKNEEIEHTELSEFPRASIVECLKLSNPKTTKKIKYILILSNILFRLRFIQKQQTQKQHSIDSWKIYYLYIDIKLDAKLIINLVIFVVCIMCVNAMYVSLDGETTKIV